MSMLVEESQPLVCSRGCHYPELILAKQLEHFERFPLVIHIEHGEILVLLSHSALPCDRAWSLFSFVNLLQNSNPVVPVAHVDTAVPKSDRMADNEPPITAS